MSSNHTANYQLCQWEPEDAVLRADFNADNAKLDAALAGKADQSALETLSQTVSGQASTLSHKGNCTVYSTSYTGNGLYGPNNRNSVSFSRTPLIAFVLCTEGTTAVFVPGQTAASSINLATADVIVNWSGSTLTWYSNSNAVVQLNRNNTTYRVVAFMTA